MSLVTSSSGMALLESVPLDPHILHPVRNPRFASFRTQPLDNLSAVVKLPIKQRFLGNPTPGTNLGQRILAMRTGCSRGWKRLERNKHIPLTVRRRNPPGPALPMCISSPYHISLCVAIHIYIYIIDRYIYIYIYVRMCILVCIFRYTHT